MTKWRVVCLFERELIEKQNLKEIFFASLARRGSKRSTENGNAVSPSISSVDLELIENDC